MCGRYDVATPHATTLYDERGARYDLPKWVLDDPDNLAPEPPPEASGGGGGGGGGGAGAGAAGAGGGGGGVEMASRFQVVV